MNNNTDEEMGKPDDNFSTTFAIFVIAAGVSVMTIFGVCKLHGSTIFAMAITMSDIVIMKMYRKIKPLLSIFIFMVTTIIVQVIVFFNLGEAKFLDHGRYIFPVGMINGLFIMWALDILLYTKILYWKK